MINAADHGVPQKRNVFYCWFPGDLGIEWSFPDATHTDALLEDQWVTGDYWEDTDRAKKRRNLRQISGDG